MRFDIPGPAIVAATLLSTSLMATPAAAVPAVIVMGAAGMTLPIERVVSRIGANRAAQDSAEVRRYRGNRGAQQILREKRRNLCRNVPEMC